MAERTAFGAARGVNSVAFKICGKNCNCAAKSDEDMIVEVKADKKYIGKFIQVRITKAMNWALRGELVEDK